MFTTAPTTRTPCALEERVVEHDLVDRPAHAALADDHHRRLEQRRHPRVGEADHRAHPGVARPLDDDQVLVLATTLLAASVTAAPRSSVTRPMM